jgi:hypothetical protein
MDKRAIAGIVVLVLGYWGVSTLRSLASRDGALKLPAEEIEAQKIIERTAASEPVAAKPVEAATAETPPPPTENPAPAIFEAQAELSAYAQLKTKVVPNATEKKERERIIHDPHTISSIGKRLLQIPTMALGQQIAAIDLLVEAFKSGDRSASEQVMREIVADKQVEDTKLPTEVREQLAGIKAEVLYNWGALAPEQQSDIARQLPGPASEQIWRNVQDTFANNLAESDLER